MATAKQKPPVYQELPKLGDFLCFAIYSTNLAVNRLKHGTPLTPEQAIREAQLTREVLKGHVDTPQ